MNAGSAAALARTAIEADLEGIWAELLGAPPRDSDHDFFEAGGSSVMAAALVARACAGLGVELPLSSFVEEPTIGSLARRIEEARTEQVRVAAEPKPAHAVAEAPPCSYAQERFLFIDEASGSNAVSNVSWALR